VYADTYQAGHQEGKQLIIYKGVGAEANGGGNKGFLLADG
jgi:hypothetical protein